ncbi:autotransporter outer membrane beta-barrel domain-containing protein [Pseudohoeflea coraliihabitans]|uniref:Autotransporter outer membrane beta-barrel domain-containing protein n=1 Tax=Pseudohoeflea coraliihabitans TaxID=2860393 RepID=A0ABS6WIU3_9HYPH|nr:autotransporter outer membrane beta-barrel domain-containing protein [Pseudohoeflea sp. DP4N28-3]MBW3095858.1 autotransporter outer membrane beta-barrel domain-containing protein [Pseudohoeflea sp. DP4N28-3]
MMLPNRSLLCILSGSTALALMAAQAAATDYVVSSDRSTTLVLSDDGDSLTVERGASIDTTAGTDHAVEANADNQRIVNFGEIFGGRSGIDIDGDNTVVINHGTIFAADRDGIYFSELEGHHNTVVNYGMISSAPGANRGVYFSETYGSFGRLDNFGTITSEGIRPGVTLGSTYGYAYVFHNHSGGEIGSAFSRGAYFSSTYGYRNSLINDGVIWSSGDAGVEFNMTGGHGNTLINNGIIRSSGGPGVDFSNSYVDPATIESQLIADNPFVSEFVPEENALFNFGLIESTVEHGVLFRSSDRTEELSNFGTIIAATGYDAIHMASDMAGSRVTLGGGSVLDGGVVFDSPDDVLMIAPGLNLHLTYDGTLEGVTSPVPFYHDAGSTMVYAIDPSGFALSQSFIETLSGAVHAAVRDASDGGPFPAGGYAQGDADGNGHVWASGFAGYQQQDGSGITTGGAQSYGGFIAGGGYASGAHSFGGFLGASHSELKSHYDAQRIDADTLFGGLYGAGDMGRNRVSASLVGGLGRFSSERTVANNTVAGGVETASGDYDGYFFSPALTVSRALNEKVAVSVGGHFASLFLDGYTETGSAANMRVSSRDLHAATIRSQVNYRAAEQHTAGGTLSVETWAGIDGVFNLGDDDVNVTLAGMPFAVAGSFGESRVSGFAGVGLKHRPDRGNWSLDASLEGRGGSDSFAEVRARASFGLMF